MNVVIIKPTCFFGQLETHHHVMSIDGDQGEAATTAIDNLSLQCSHVLGGAQVDRDVTRNFAQN